MADQPESRIAPFSSAPPPGKEWWRPRSLSRPGSEVAANPAAAAPPEMKLEPREVEARTMIVGSETSFFGEINSCNRLVVEGTVDAKLGNCEEVLVKRGGIFKGQCVTEDAEIQGSLKGDLVVRKRLVIRATGRVSGVVTYGEVEIERGGKLTGVVQAAGERSIPKAVRAAATKARAANGHGPKSAQSPTDTQNGTNKTTEQQTQSWGATKSSGTLPDTLI
jgi:cytoskeletal protein CcmA (bactofilin family)